MLSLFAKFPIASWGAVGALAFLAKYAVYVHNYQIKYHSWIKTRQMELAQATIDAAKLGEKQIE